MKRIILTTFLLIFMRQAMLGQDSLTVEKTGIYLGLNFGTWFPDNKNKVLGNPPIVGFTADLKFYKNAFGVNFDLIGWPKGKTTQPILIKFGDSTLIRNEYSGAQFTLDYFRQLFQTKRFAFEALCAIGYGTLSYYNPDENTNIHKGSLVCSPGLSIRYIIGKKTYLQLKTQYCIANYALKDKVSTDLKGNYLTTKLIFGGFTGNSRHM
jgi:hypothetical protein